MLGELKHNIQSRLEKAFQDKNYDAARDILNDLIAISVKIDRIIDAAKVVEECVFCKEYQGRTFNIMKPVIFKAFPDFKLEKPVPLKSIREMSVEEIDALVEQRKREGWVEGQWTGTSLSIYPPANDRRIGWCAEWIQYKPNYYVPHWIARDDV